MSTFYSIESYHDFFFLPIIIDPMCCNSKIRNFPGTGPKVSGIADPALSREHILNFD